MRVCGVELKNLEAIICLLNYERETFNIPECRVRSLNLTDATKAEGIKEFHFKFAKLMEDYRVDQIAIIKREHKGRYAGSANSFKVETIIQLGNIPTELVSPTDIKYQLKRNPPMADFSGLSLKLFQKNAFDVAFAYQNQCIYSKNSLDTV